MNLNEFVINKNNDQKTWQCSIIKLCRYKMSNLIAVDKKSVNPIFDRDETFLLLKYKYDYMVK